MIKSFFYTLKQSLLQLVRNKTMALTSLFSITAMLLILGMFFIDFNPGIGLITVVIMVVDDTSVHSISSVLLV